MKIIIEELKKNISEIEEKIGYSFKDKDHLFLALTHSSFANENKSMKIKSNERLEFLGDAILNIIISEKIYLNFTGLEEGDMTKVRANIVCEQSLMNCSNTLEIGNYLLLGKGEELTGGRSRISILSDAFEALLGAIYIDGGMEEAKRFIGKQMGELIENSACGLVFMDYKTLFQEMIQKNSENKIAYEVINEEGPDHNKMFVSQVKVSNIVMGTGKGKSKKEAEQNAAQAAIEHYQRVQNV